MKTTISNEIIVEHPSKELLAWCEENLVYKNPDYYKKLRMGLYLGNLPSKIYMYKRNQFLLYLPFGTLKRVWKFIKDSPYEVKFKAKRIFPVSSIRLYDYQEKAVENLLRGKSGILISQAGSGKSLVMLELICRLGYKALWINNKIDLMSQAYNTAKDYIKNVTFGKISGGKIDIQDITFSTVQTLANIDLEKYKDEWAVIVVDECHQCCGTPTKVTQFSKVLSSLSARFKFGCTATLHRSDGLEQTCRDLIGDVIYEVPKEEIADKIIKSQIYTVKTSYKPSYKVRNADGTIKNFAMFINELCEDENRNEIILKYLRENINNHCLVLSDRVSHLNYLRRKLKKGVVIDSKMTKKEDKIKRRKALEDMRSGKENILFATYSLAKEGLDIPILDRLFLTTPKKDLTVVIQSVGRIERRYDGKTLPIAYDFVDSREVMLEKMYTARKRIYKKNGNIIKEEE